MNNPKLRRLLQTATHMNATPHGQRAYRRTTYRTSYGRRIVARLVVRRHGLLALALYFAIGSCALATTRH